MLQFEPGHYAYLFWILARTSNPINLFNHLQICFLKVYTDLSTKSFEANTAGVSSALSLAQKQEKELKNRKSRKEVLPFCLQNAELT